MVLKLTKSPGVPLIPFVSPDRVTVTAVLAGTVPDSSVTTMLELPLEVEDAFAPPLTETLDGVTPTVKKPVG